MNKRYSKTELLETIVHWHDMTQIYISKALSDDHIERLEAIRELIEKYTDADK